MKLFALSILVSCAALAQTPPPLDPALGEPPLDKGRKSHVVGTIKTPKVYFVTPKDGATVKPKFKIKFGVEGMSVKPAETMEVGTGHHHIIVNGASIPKGQVIPKDEKHIHFGKGETQTELNLPPGEHTLTLQFADGAHLSYGPELSATIKVKVK
ncbi:MAG TPA: DUF4399 domain-containing protein [Bdellovibrionales bacterium]|nr:DUF4399 domain-containing protein [Bdellovibrionales bacterium]